MEDAGEYVCEAENILGKDTARGRLHVNSGRWTLGQEGGFPEGTQALEGGLHMICLACSSPPHSGRCPISSPRSELIQRNAVKA